MTLPEETWVSIFMLLDVWSAIYSASVSKEWRKWILGSPQFREKWCRKHGRDTGSVLLSFSVEDGEKPAFLRFCEPPKNTRGSYLTSADLSTPFVSQQLGPCEMVSSSNGLLLARLDHGGETRFDFAVGNPLTGEWVRIPRPAKEMREIIPFETTFNWDFNLKAEPSGEFKFFAFQCYDGVLLIYDSRTKAWTQGSRSPFPKEVCYLYDLDKGSWTVYELPEDCADFDEHAFLQGACVWEHEGETYVGGVLISAQLYSSYGVWKLVKGQRASKVSDVNAAWGMPCPNEDQISHHNCHGEGKLYCTAGAGYESRCPWAPAIYDLSSDNWVCLEELGERGTSEVYCSRALAYHASLIMPAGLTEEKKRNRLASDQTTKAKRIRSSTPYDSKIYNIA